MVKIVLDDKNPLFALVGHKVAKFVEDGKLKRLAFTADALRTQAAEWDARLDDISKAAVPAMTSELVADAEALREVFRNLTTGVLTDIEPYGFEPCEACHLNAVPHFHFRTPQGKSEDLVRFFQSLTIACTMVIRGHLHPNVALALTHRATLSSLHT